MKQNIHKRLEELERLHAADLRETADRAAAPSAMDWFRETMRHNAIGPLPGESQADAFARFLGISSRELADRLQYGRCRTASPRRLRQATAPAECRTSRPRPRHSARDRVVRSSAPGHHYPGTAESSV